MIKKIIFIVLFSVLVASNANAFIVSQGESVTISEDISESIFNAGTITLASNPTSGEAAVIKASEFQDFIGNIGGTIIFEGGIVYGSIVDPLMLGTINLLNDNAYISGLLEANTLNIGSTTDSVDIYISKLASSYNINKIGRAHV